MEIKMIDLIEFKGGPGSGPRKGGGKQGSSTKKVDSILSDILENDGLDNAREQDTEDLMSAHKLNKSDAVMLREKIKEAVKEEAGAN